jgi:hypothetical protein
MRMDGGKKRRRVCSTTRVRLGSDAARVSLDFSWCEHRVSLVCTILKYICANDSQRRPLGSQRQLSQGSPRGLPGPTTVIQECWGEGGAGRSSRPEGARQPCMGTFEAAQREQAPLQVNCALLASWKRTREPAFFAGRPCEDVPRRCAVATEDS